MATRGEAKAQQSVDSAHVSLDKTRKELGNSYLKYLESLSDVNSRSTCPRCSGESFLYAYICVPAKIACIYMCVCVYGIWWES
jgi:hypothetical protein